MSARGAIAFAVMLAATAIAAPPASAQTQQQIIWCNGEDDATPDLQISGCTALIQSGRYQGNDLAKVFNNRGIAYRNKGEYDRAFQDFNQAIKLNPQFAFAFNSRGIAYQSKGQYDCAIEDYDQAIKLNPQFAFAFNSRGLAYQNKGRYDRAFQDFDEAIKLNPQFADAFYNRSLAKKKGDEAGAEADLAAARKINPNVGR